MDKNYSYYREGTQKKERIFFFNQQTKKTLKPFRGMYVEHKIETKLFIHNHMCTEKKTQ
jgi:hypothetical protein